MTLPDKPEQVAHVSDALWEAALNAAFEKFGGGYLPWRQWDRNTFLFNVLIDHARLLILQGEVEEPVDLLKVKCGLIVQEWHSASRAPKSMADIIRKHLAGMTIPEATQ